MEAVKVKAPDLAGLAESHRAYVAAVLTYGHAVLEAHIRIAEKIQERAWAILLPPSGR